MVGITVAIAANLSAVAATPISIPSSSEKSFSYNLFYRGSVNTASPRGTSPRRSASTERNHDDRDSCSSEHRCDERVRHQSVRCGFSDDVHEGRRLRGEFLRDGEGL